MLITSGLWLGVELTRLLKPHNTRSPWINYRHPWKAASLHLQAKGSCVCNDALGQELCGIADLLPARCSCCACTTNPGTCMRLAHLEASSQHFQAKIAVHCWALMTSSTVRLCRRRCPDCQRLPQRLYSGSEGIHAGICECHWHLGRLLRNTGVSVRPILGMLLYTRMAHTSFHKPAHLQPHVLEAAQLPGARESQLLSRRWPAGSTTH